MPCSLLVAPKGGKREGGEGDREWGGGGRKEGVI